jgi:hypothetical protein
MNLIAKVQELKALEPKATPCPYRLRDDDIINEADLWIGPGINDENYMLMIGLRNAAPAMLDVLSMIRPGDAERLKMVPCFRPDGDCAKCSEGMTAVCETVERMQEMCREMEAGE